MKVIVFAFVILSQAWNAIAQENCYTYLKNSKEWSRVSSNFSTEVLLFGTFHFSKKFELTNVRDQLINFAPEAIFVEEISPSAVYKSAYKDELYSGFGVSLYSRKLDSLKLFTGLTEQFAKDVVIHAYKEPRTVSLDVKKRAGLINALFLTKDEVNAMHQKHLLDVQLQSLPSEQQDSIRLMLSPYHKRITFTSGETRHLAIPVAVAVALPRLHYMDYQQNRKQNDSLLSITIRKLMPRQAVKIWKLPYMIKMMRLNKKGPRSEEEAASLIKTLNSKRTILTMAKMNEKWFRKKNVPPSIAWNSLYRNRNKEMVTQILSGIQETQAKRAVVIVGASHLPYFIYELSKISTVKVTLFETKD